ncbi:YodC family protein [Sphingobacterium zeae]|uniref:YodC family protein n=1 Tax=Sphingobacterium zeae TaxID=1776859 RepID=UPI0036068EBB
MISKKFSKGDVVRLKSGGPKMTIEGYEIVMGWDFTSESDDTVVCKWFDLNEVLQVQKFNHETLEIVAI